MISKNTTVRIKDIAERARVSVGTVDRVLHNRGRVSDEARRRVLQVMDELPYEPNLLARTLGSHRQHRLAALLPDPQRDPYWQAPAQGLEKAAQDVRSYGIQVDFFHFDPYDFRSFQMQATHATQSQPDGIILAPVFYRESLPFFAQWQTANLPVIQFNTEIREYASLSFIGQDLYQSGRLAGQLLHYGLSPGAAIVIAHIAEDITNSVHLMRKEQGFRAYFATNTALAGPHTLITANLDRPAEAAFTQQLDALFRQHPNVGGIFITTSKAYAIAAYLEKSGHPAIRLVGYDLIEQNVRYLQTGYIHFLIHQNARGQGYWSVRQLTDYLVFKKDVPSVRHLPLDIVTRENVPYYLEPDYV